MIGIMSEPSSSLRVIFRILLYGVGGVIVVFALFLIYAAIFGPLPLPPSVVDNAAMGQEPRPYYDGDGVLIAHITDDPIIPEGPGVVIDAPLASDILGETRPLMVYLPPGYDENCIDAYPVIFTLHGSSGRAQTWINLLIDPLESAIETGTMPPVVVVSGDYSIAGNGTDDPRTPFDDRRGARYINSNRGRFRDHFFEEIVPFIFENYHVRTDPGGVVLMGNSMGGFGVLYYALTEPNFSHVLVPIYPTADMRYGIDGDKIAPYNPESYRPINTDNPKRIVNGAPLFGLFGVTEQWIYYAVFNSDTEPGEVWTNDLPVWKRLKDHNPADILRDSPPDLSDQRYFIIAGDRDEFNSDDVLKVLLPLLESAGALVDPETNIIPGGFHDDEFVTEHLDDIFLWLSVILTVQD